MITIANKHDYDIHNQVDVIIPIHRGFPLGNPWTHISNRQTKALYICPSRAESISRYKNWLRAEMDNDNPEVMNELKRIYRFHAQGKSVVLLCYCVPLPCHGEFIKQIAEQDPRVRS